VCYSFVGSTEVLGSETAKVHYAAWRRATWAVPTANAQQSQKLRRIGILNPESTSLAPLPAFLDELRLLGWRDQENLVLDIRSAEGRYELIPTLADDLIRARADVIYTLGPDATLATAAATKAVPIVAIDLETHPVTTGLVEKLSRPGHNLTGLFLDLPEIAGKWLEFLGETVPQLSRVGVVGTARINKAQFAAREAVAPASKRYCIASMLTLRWILKLLSIRRFRSALRALLSFLRLWSSTIGLASPLLR
jgi:hypothetical protein